jgi:hypothetical protein
MGVLISIARRKAFLRRGRWVSANAEIEQMLNAATDSWIRETGGPPIDSPDPEHALAAEMVRRFGGRILGHSTRKDNLVRRLYFSRRQLLLDFSKDENTNDKIRPLQS